MEADDRLILWALAQRASGNLNFEVDRFDWPSKLGILFHDIRVRLILSGSEYVGRGTGNTFKQSFAIALTEAFERTVAMRLSTGSNGLAAHTDMEAAKLSARNELIERDAFLTTYLNGIPTMPIRIENIQISPHMTAAICHLRNHGIEVEVYGVARSFDNFVVTAVINGLGAQKKFGLNLGLGCDMDFDVAARKAILEVVRNGMWAIDGRSEIDPLTVEKFYGLPYFRCVDHLSLALDQSYAKEMLLDLKGRGTVSEPVLLPAHGTFQYLIHSWSPDLSEPPLYAVQCVNRELLKLSWGPTHEKYVDPCAANTRVLRSSRLNNLLPHPIG